LDRLGNFVKISVDLNKNPSFKLHRFDHESIEHIKDEAVLIVNRNELNELIESGISFGIIEADCEAVNSIEISKKMNQFKDNYTFSGEFQLGSLGGYHNFQEIHEFFDSMVQNSPFPIYVDTIGFSIENRPILAYHIGDTLTNNSVLLTSLIHAREPGSVSVLMYWLSNLATEYKNGVSKAKFIIENRHIAIVPIVNPDGVLFNEANYPQGGGMWRKNRRNNGDGTFGVDLNRNFGPLSSWDMPNDGSSIQTKDETYRGLSPFSEPEAVAIRDFCNISQFRIAMNYHTFGDMILLPDDKGEHITPNFYDAFGMETQRLSGYIYGLSLPTVGYPVRGSTDQWMMLKEQNREAISAMTPEVGRIGRSFWRTPADSILIQCQVNSKLIDNVVRGASVNIRPVSANVIQKESKLFLQIRLVNIGLDGSRRNEYFLKVDFSENPIRLFNNIHAIPALQSGDEYMVEEELVFLDSFNNADEIEILIDVSYKDFNFQDNFKIRPGFYEDKFLFSDSLFTSNWKTKHWGLEFDNTKSKLVLNDSPYISSYPLDSAVLEFLEPISLSDFNFAELIFDTRWEIERFYDFGWIEIKNSSENQWQNAPLAERMVHSENGFNGRQPLRTHGYHGIIKNWCKEKMSLQEYLNQDINLRFLVSADANKNYSGLYLDSILIRKYPKILIPKSGLSVEANFNDIINIYPNPAKPGETVFISEDTSVSNIKLFDFQGNKVEIDFNNFKSSFIVPESVSAGVYILQFDINAYPIRKKVLILP